MAIQFNARLVKSVDYIQSLARIFIVHHFNPKFGVGCVNRNVNRAYMHLYNAVNLVFGNVGEGNIITEKEGKAGIIVLKIKTASQSFRQLVDKAENALVSAGMFLIH